VIASTTGSDGGEAIEFACDVDSAAVELAGDCAGLAVLGEDAFRFLLRDFRVMDRSPGGIDGFESLESPTPKECTFQRIDLL
jgi:hypothetical protein